MRNNENKDDEDTVGQPAGAVIEGQGRQEGGKARLVLHLLVLVILSGALFLFRADSLALADPEEARCALITRNMLVGGHWIIPQLDGEPYYDKPSPFFWLAAAGQVLTGSDELGGRVVAALAGMVAVLAAYLMGRRMFGPAAGLLAGVILVTCGEFLFLARWYRMDMPFVVAMWLAIWCFWRRRVETSDQARRGSYLGFYAFCAVATLFKGPAGLVLPVLIVAFYLLLAGRPRRVLELLNLRGLGLYLLIAAPWYVAASLLDPHYAYEFFINQNIERYTSHRFGHNLPAVINLVYLLIGCLPWTVYLPGVFIRFFPRSWRRRAERPGVLLMLLAAIVPLVFFTVGKTRLVDYILPCYPPLAVLMGALIAQWIAAPGRDRLLETGAKAMQVVIVIMPLLSLGLAIVLGVVGWWLVWPAALTVVAAGGMQKACRGNRKGWAMVLGVAAVVVNFLAMIGWVAPAGYDRKSARSLVRESKNHGGRPAKLCFYPDHSYSMLYYAGFDQAMRFRGGSAEELWKMADQLASRESVWFLMSGRDRLDALRAAYGDLKLEVIAEQRPLWLFPNSGRFLVANVPGESAATSKAATTAADATTTSAPASASAPSSSPAGL
jgi:4-amino-4-deoxy-L-arabinose transferase-like glycosyltransferase